MIRHLLHCQLGSAKKYAPHPIIGTKGISFRGTTRNSLKNKRSFFGADTP
jgi:hypothetical protein